MSMAQSRPKWKNPVPLIGDIVYTVLLHQHGDFTIQSFRMVELDQVSSSEIWPRLTEETPYGPKAHLRKARTSVHMHPSNVFYTSLEDAVKSMIEPAWEFETEWSDPARKWWEEFNHGMNPSDDSPLEIPE